MTEIKLGSVLRTARRERDFSQRELAELASVPVSTVARIESGAVTDPRFRTVERLLAAAGRRLLPAVTEGSDTADADGHHGRDEVGEDDRPTTRDADPSAAPPVPHESLRDHGGRHYPAHLDVYDVFPWFDRKGDMLPAGTRVQTFHRNRGLRDDLRERDAPGKRVTIEYHEAEAGHAWSWQASCDDHMVGRLTAQIWPPATSPPDPPRLTVLCCLVMQPEWTGKGVEQRLIACLQEIAAKKGNDWTVVTLAYPGLPWGYVGSYGFHKRVRGIQLLQLTR